MCVSGHSWTVLCQRLGHSRFFDLGVNIDSIDHWLECASGYSFYIRVRICIICFFFIFSGID